MTYYDEIASGYEELHSEEQLAKIGLIKDHFRVTVKDKLLDVGCGTGLTTEPWNCIRTGVDPAPQLLARARSSDEITYVEAAAEHLPFDDSTFDVVISITAIQNFSDVAKGLSEIKRVGKNRFVLSFLRKSAQAEEIESLIRSLFVVDSLILESKDVIFFCSVEHTNA
jgi:ubiquinone/menaquinone biosynthesis C-methylase UbiE|tara:strand:+ start:926 stop:1429 length:504 start_codon:yes stop_codon:yes gene_type:complete